MTQAPLSLTILFMILMVSSWLHRSKELVGSSKM